MWKPMMSPSQTTISSAKRPRIPFSNWKTTGSTRAGELTVLMKSWRFMFELISSTISLAGKSTRLRTYWGMQEGLRSLSSLLALYWWASFRIGSIFHRLSRKSTRLRRHHMKGSKGWSKKPEILSRNKIRLKKVMESIKQTLSWLFTPNYPSKTKIMLLQVVRASSRGLPTLYSGWKPGTTRLLQLKIRYEGSYLTITTSFLKLKLKR
jgi:hypothetical protein